MIMAGKSTELRLPGWDFQMEKKIIDETANSSMICNSHRYIARIWYAFVSELAHAVMF